MATDWKEIPGDSKEKYSLYLLSLEWKDRRTQVFDRAGGWCERCRLNPIDDVHHLTYVRKYNESPDDLLGLCRGCHQFEHGLIVEDPQDDNLHGNATLYRESPSRRGKRIEGVSSIHYRIDRNWDECGMKDGEFRLFLENSELRDFGLLMTEDEFFELVQKTIFAVAAMGSRDLCRKVREFCRYSAEQNW